MYKVFYNDKAIYLSGESAELIPDCTTNEVRNKKELFIFLRFFFKGDQKKNTCLAGYQLKKMVDDFIAFFHFTEAAGGLVSNTDNKFLFIKRFDIWDLPKGKVEKNESPQEAALREVEEETGVTDLMIVNALLPTYHVYLFKDKLMLKKTFWYRMKTKSGRTKLKPQLKESITEAVWLDLAQSKKALSGSYRSLYETLSPFLEA